MTPREFFDTAITPAFQLLPSRMNSPEAALILIAIALQETRLEDRWQVIDRKRPSLKGPARSLLQFERGTKKSRGGVCGVMLHPASRYWLHGLCEARRCPFTAWAIWRAIETDDVLTAGLGRLLVFTDPERLPPITDATGAYRLYLRCWEPGKRRPEDWPGNHQTAYEFIAGDG